MEAIVEAGLPLDALNDLMLHGVCPKCTLRFLGACGTTYKLSSETLIPALLKSSKDLSQTSEGSSNISRENEVSEGTGSPCIVCLGILEILDEAEESKIVNKGQLTMLQSMVDTIQKEKYQFDTFCLEITLPGAVSVREHALWQYVQEKYVSEAWLGRGSVNDCIVSLKEALKFSIVESLEKQLGAKYDTGSIFHIVLLYKHIEASKELDFLGLGSGNSKKRKQNGSDEDGCKTGLAVVHSAREQLENGAPLLAIQRALDSMSSEKFKQLYPFPPKKLQQPSELTTMCYRSAVYVGGRYLKFSRNISQSRWMIEEDRKGDGSVQEIIADVVAPAFKADSYKFHASGREDIDVRMLGDGRPFILELLNARIIPTQEEISKLEEEINGLKEGWVKVRALQQAGLDARNLLLQGESEKQKQYTAVVWLSRPITKEDLDCLSGMRDLEIQQKTPVRVLHRRSPLVRPRTIHWMKGQEIPGQKQYLLLHLCTQAGTYIKEFVHGDLGRTHPNIGSILGCQAEIPLLDVTNIKMDLFN